MSQQANQPQQPPSPPRPSSPFGSSATPSSPPANPPASPFGSPPAGGTPPAAPAPTPAPSPTPARPTFGSSLRSRLGPTKLSWEIVPVVDTVARFDLNGLGDPFHRLLGHSLNVDYGDYKTVIKAMETGGDDVSTLEARLNEAWTGYGLAGAMLVYPWRDEVRQALVARPKVDLPEKKAPAQDEEDDVLSEEPPEEDKRNGAAPICIRSIDLLLVLNVLARARSQILLAATPLAFEGSYLERSLVTDDPRLVALARATGYVEEALTK